MTSMGWRRRQTLMLGILSARVVSNSCCPALPRAMERAERQTHAFEAMVQKSLLNILFLAAAQTGHSQAPNIACGR